MSKPDAHKWEFKPRFRRHAFGWRSQPAILRVRQAVAEIKSDLRALAASRRGGSGFVAEVLGRELGLP